MLATCNDSVAAGQFWMCVCVCVLALSINRAAFINTRYSAPQLAPLSLCVYGAGVHVYACARAWCVYVCILVLIYMYVAVERM